MFSYVFLFSAAGSLASGLAVYVLHALLRKCGGDRLISNVGLCLFGALANNAAQVVVARLVIFGPQAYVIAPLLLASGLVSGLALGGFANKFEEKSAFLKAAGGSRERPLPQVAAGGEGDAPAVPAAGGGAFRIARAVAALVLMLLLPFLPGLRSKAAVWCVLLVLDEVARKGRVRLLPSFIMIAGLTVLSLLAPSGKVLYELGGFRITRDALEAGLSKGLTLTGMLFASQLVFDGLRGRILGQGGGAGCGVLGMVGSVFSDFSRLSGRKLDIKGRGLMAALDGRLCEVWQGTAGTGGKE